MSCLKSGVDSRTGLYNISINLPELQANHLRGPGFAVGLAYSPLNTLDSGFGKGWSLQLSQYDPSNQVLSLSTGEAFKVTGSGDVNGLLPMKEKKLDSFHFYRQDDGRYRVMHKSGLVEILERKSNGVGEVALPVQIQSASGHTIKLDYEQFSTRHRLKSITDSLGESLDQPLMLIKRDSASVELLLHPYAGPVGGPLARFVMHLRGTDDDTYVSRISLPTEDEASWRFEYELREDQRCVAQVFTPTGASERLFYQDEGHPFPVGSGRRPLPRVTRHVIYPGFEQPNIDVRYTYKK
jgi:hypothetical protein